MPDLDLKAARYAPGEYLCTCSECAQQFAGDKRATRCQSCAAFVARIADLEAALRSIRDIATEAAHLAATIATAETGDARNRIMSVSNMLKAALGRSQSSHGDKFDAQGNKTER